MPQHPERRLPAVQAFLTHIPRPVLRDLTQGVLAAYPKTNAQIEKYWTGPEAISLRPQIHRANTHAELRAVCERHAGNGLRFSQPPNKNHSDWHMEVYAGPITLLDAYLAAESDTPRSAQYRTLLTEANQPSLFGDLPLVDLETRLTAFIVHGCNVSNARERLGRVLPDFAHVRFVLTGNTSYASDGINLAEMFPELFVAAARDQENVPDQAQVQIRHRKTGDSE